MNNPKKMPPVSNLPRKSPRDAKPTDGRRTKRQRINGRIQCRKCGEWQSEARFRQNKNCAWGRTGTCHLCANQRQRSRPYSLLQHLDRLARNHDRKSTYRSPLRKKLYTNSCITFDFLLTLWEKQNGRCAVTGRPMTYERNKGRIPTNVSIDRIDPDGLYTPENVRLVCFQINQMRNRMTDDQLLFWCDAILKGRKNPIALKDIPEDTIHEFTRVRRGGRKREVRNGTICCSHCKGWKPLSAFSKNKRSSVGRKSECKDCFNKSNTARLERQQNGTLMKPGHPARKADNGNLQCNTCGTFKPIAAFERHRASTHGVMSRCKECSSSRVMHQVTSNLAQFLRRMATSLKRRKWFTACVNYHFLIAMLWHRQNGKCTVTGRPMKHHLGDRYHPENASIDRIDSRRHYIPENVRLVCWAVNHMKGELTDDELYDWCEAVLNPLS